MGSRNLIARLADIRVVLGVIAIGAGVAFLYDVVSDESPGDSGTAFERIDAFVEDQMGDSRIPGVAIAVVEGDEIIHARGFGEDGHGGEVTEQTPFWIGSNTKSFTAMAIMQLAEAGQIDVDAPVQEYIPSFTLADEEAASEITVRHLLNQTSGFSREDGLTPVLEEKEQTLEEAVADMSTVELNRPVGESFEYSNLNFVVLGLVVEEVSGVPWAEYIEANIFEPLGMTRSYTSLEEAEENGLTRMYSYAFGARLEREPKYLEGLAPTGYIYSTAEDMAGYLSAYLEDGGSGDSQVLSPAGVEQMLAPNTDEVSRQLLSHDFTYRYAQGWFAGDFGEAEDARWHLGTLHLFTAWMVLMPETDQGVVVLINSSSQIEVLGATSVFSRIPIGVVDILQEEDPPSGISLTRFYIFFNAVVLAILAVQGWSLVRVARRPAPLKPGLRLALYLAPLLWELVLSVFLLANLEAVLGMDWSAAYRSMPDVTVVMLAMLSLWVITGIVRVGRVAYGMYRERTGGPTQQAAEGDSQA